MNNKKIYFAAPLFSKAEQMYNTNLATLLREAIDGVEIYVPQENFAINDKSKVVTSDDIFIGDIDELEASEYVIALIDGSEIDSGVAAELGWAAKCGKKIFALKSDIRLMGHNDALKLGQIEADPFENPIVYTNLFVVGLINRNGMICRSEEELIAEVVKEFNK